MASFPRDQFDELPGDLARVGAHRAPKPSGRGWIGFAWAALATGLLVVAGLYGLSRYNEDFAIDLPGLGGAGEPTAAPTASQAPGVEPITDPAAVPAELELSILVLNGTATAGLQDRIGDQLADGGWPISSRVNASADDVTETVVYYRSAEYEAVALGLVEVLGAQRAQLSDAYQGAPVTVVVGADLADAAG